jgi:mono/diheme cytochrome c family protein
VRAYLSSHCNSCHSGESPKADLDLAALLSASDFVSEAEDWLLVARRIESGDMPPPARPRPPEAETKAMLEWIRAAMLSPGGKTDPGRVTLRRLNRVEFANTVRDLFGIALDASAELPADDVGYGFDNIGDVLSVSPLLVEKYLRAARRIAEEATKEGSPGRTRLGLPPTAGSASDEEVRRAAEGLAARAHRRPPLPEDLARLAKLLSEERAAGGSAEDALRLAIEALVLSPRFLFRVEADLEGGLSGDADSTSDRLPDRMPDRVPEAASDRESKHVSQGATDRVRDLDGYELASRLSYFLWSSMPDDALFDAAQKGELADPAVLEAQALRLLRDPRASALVGGFASQWLQVGRLEKSAPDPKLFPGFDKDLEHSMRKETELFAAYVIGEDRSVLDFLDGDYSFLDERLARHYGIEGVTGPEFRRVALGGSARGGVLTHGSVLVATSNPTRTSPVKRGKWVLEVLLGAPPPPPPPDVPELPEKAADGGAATVRERLERHRVDPACAGCHARMDPLGFGLENFDASGAWREKDGETALDVAGELPDGRKFQGPRELKAILREEADQFRRAISERLLTYALGRGVTAKDEAALRGIVEELRKGGDRFSALVRAVARSEPFRRRRVEA